MSTFAELFGQAWRPYEVDGVPASGPHNPNKADIRQVGAALDIALASVGVGSGASDIIDLNSAGVGITPSLDPTAVGVAGAVSDLHEQRDICRTTGKSMSGFGTFLVDQAADLTVTDLRLGRVAFKPAANLGATLAGAPALDIGGQPANRSMRLTKNIQWLGDKANQSTAFTAIRIRGDQGPNNAYTVFGGDHKGDYVVIDGDCEKKQADIHAYGVEGGAVLSVLEQGGGSPDEIDVRITGASCDEWYRDSGSVSVQAHFDVEDNVDAGGYCINVGTEKAWKGAGEIRAINGKGLQVYRASAQAGVIVLNNPMIVHAPDGLALDIVNPRQLTGHFAINGAGASAASGVPTGWIRGPTNSCDVSGSMEDIGGALGGALGFRFGDSSTETGSVRTMRGKARLAIFMSTAAQADDTAVAVEIQRCADFQLELDTNHNVVIGPDCSGLRMTLPSSWLSLGRAVTKDAAASGVELRLVGGVQSSALLGLPWLFEGVVAENVVDWNCSMRFGADGRWHPLIILSASQASMENSGSLYNNDLKATNAVLICSDDHLLYVSQGSTPLDEWQPATGSNIVPMGLAVTTALASRITATGASAASGALLSAYDQLYTDLIDGNLIDLTSLGSSWLKVLYEVPVHDERVFQLNLAEPGGTYDLTKSGTTTFAAKDYVSTNGTTGYYSTGWNVESALLGTAHDDLALTVLAEGGVSGDNGYALSSNNQRTRVRAHQANTSTAGTINQTSTVSAVTAISLPVVATVSRRPALVNGLEIYLQGNLNNTRTSVAPASAYTDTLELLRSGSTYLQSTARYSAFAAHKGADATKASALAAALLRFRLAARAA